MFRPNCHASIPKMPRNYVNSLFYSYRGKQGWSWPWALTICMENSEIPGRIQMELFIPVEIFQKKSNTFRGITFFPFLPKWPKFSAAFVWITSARLHVERKWKIYEYFVNGTTQSHSCFQCQKKYQYHLTEIFHRNFHTNGKHSLFSLIQLFLLSFINEVVLMLTSAVQA